MESLFLNQTTVIGKNCKIPFFINDKDFVVFEIEQSIFEESEFFICDEHAEIIVDTEFVEEDRIRKKFDNVFFLGKFEPFSILENLDNKLYCNFEVSFNYLYDCVNLGKEKDIFILESDIDCKVNNNQQFFYLKNFNFFGNMNFFNDFDNCLVHNNKFSLNLKSDLKEILFFEKIEKEKNAFELEIIIKNNREKFYYWKKELIKELKLENKEKNFLLKINQNIMIKNSDFILKIKYNNQTIKYLLIEKMSKFVKSQIIYFLQTCKINFIYLDKFLFIKNKIQQKKFNNNCEQIKNFLENKNSQKTFGLLIKGSRKSGKTITMKNFLEKISYPFTIINLNRLLNNYKPQNYKDFKNCLEDNIADKNLFTDKIVICFEDFHVLFSKKEDNKEILLKIRIDLEELIKKLILITDKLVLIFNSEFDNIEEFNYYIDEKCIIENPKEEDLNKIFIEENLNIKEEDMDWLKNLNFGEISQLINTIKKSDYLKEPYKIQNIISQIKSKKQSKKKAYNFSKVFGMFKIKKQITQIYTNPIKYDFLYSKIKIKIPKSNLKRHSPLRPFRLRKNISRKESKIRIQNKFHPYKRPRNPRQIHRFIRREHPQAI